MKVKGGVTRRVFLIGNYAIKFPTMRHGWFCFVLGFTHNMREHSTWKSAPKNKDHEKLLCPVLCGWAGFFIVMQRADNERYVNEFNDWCNNKNQTHEEKIKFCSDMYHRWEKAGVGGDDNVNNYGYLGDRVVKIDYASIDRYVSAAAIPN